MPKYNNPRKTWFYSNEFKIKAVKLSYQPYIQSKQVADGLGIHPLYYLGNEKNIEKKSQAHIADLHMVIQIA